MWWILSFVSTKMRLKASMKSSRARKISSRKFSNDRDSLSITLVNFDENTYGRMTSSTAKRCDVAMRDTQRSICKKVSSRGNWKKVYHARKVDLTGAVNLQKKNASMGRQGQMYHGILLRSSFCFMGILIAGDHWLYPLESHSMWSRDHREFVQVIVREL